MSISIPIKIASLDEIAHGLESGEEVNIGQALFDLLRQKPVNPDETEIVYRQCERSNSKVYLVSIKGYPVGVRVDIPAYDMNDQRGLILLASFLQEAARDLTRDGHDFTANQHAVASLQLAETKRG